MMRRVMHYEIRECLSNACCFRFPVLPGDGVVLACPRCASDTRLAGTHSPDRDVPVAAPPRRGPTVVALLDNIRSAFNVGSMFRIADGAGIAHLHLAGITATPEHPRLPKTALGAERSVPWTYHPNPLTAARALAADGYELWTLEAAASAASLFAPTPALAGPIALIVGHEVAGVDPEIQALSPRQVRIPMLGHKRSLNVAVAFGIAAYTLCHGSLRK